MNSGGVLLNDRPARPRMEHQLSHINKKDIPFRFQISCALSRAFGTGVSLRDSNYLRYARSPALDKTQEKSSSISHRVCRETAKYDDPVAATAQARTPKESRGVNSPVLFAGSEKSYSNLFPTIYIYIACAVYHLLLILFLGNES